MKYLMCLICVALVACQPTSFEFVQLSSTINSAGNVSATWSETSEGATTDFVYRLHIHKNSSLPQIDKNNEILRTNSIVDTTLEWQSSQALKITCLRGDVYFWINRSVIEGQDIRIELDSQCSETIRDQWTYIAPGTEKGKIPEIMLRDPRVQQSLSKENNSLDPNTALRALYNSEKTKEVIEIRQD